MEPIKLIEKYYDKNSKAYKIVVKHAELVTEKALDVASRIKELNPDVEFLREAAMLHEIGLFLVDAPGFDCHGKEHYLMHGPLGREVLEKEGFPKHALVCERHTGMGISKEEIIEGKLPLPARDQIPISLEEEIVCFADKFFSKHPEKIFVLNTIDEIREELSRYGEEKVKKFEEMLVKFKEV